MSWHPCKILPLFLSFFAVVSAESCINAQATSKVYSTSNVLLSTESVFLIESTVKCSNNPKNVFLFAEIDGNLYPVPKSDDNSVHQFSWVKSHKEAKSGSYEIKYYDEEGYASLRKAQRTGEKLEQKPLFTVTLNHKAASREGLWVQTEFIAVTAALLVWWFATVTKNKLQE
ncbi:translocon-associated protein subunit delta-like [Xenia sp. Carnegie-2017]|uniref:translocon-associated protein subunit delta-like n=1 Tax=Xenia sp. Carnegie-2017 TaxID=2897299 RepID=UPI001F040688|nr:translocon-associated protein subunit delta-like [Xenia sp. Carnegie-2017]